MKRAIITVGLGFGDCGKGATVDYLCRKFGADGVIRYCGGPQCAHTVVLPDGRSHTFAMFGAGTLAGYPTYLGPQVIVNPGNVLREADALGAMLWPDRRDPRGAALDTLAIHPDCLVTTWFAREMNRVRERARGGLRHGSCGQGVGETRAYHLKYGADAVTMDDCTQPRTLMRKLQLQRQRFLAELGSVASSFGNPVETSDVSVAAEFEALTANAHRFNLRAAVPGGWDTVVFEGAQGVLLDEWRGFHPHTTWSTVTPLHAREMAALAGCDRVTTVGVTRAYTTRHGAGPMPTAGSASFPDPANPYNEWQGAMRTGWLDLPLLRYAAKCCGGLDGIAVTCLDQFGDAGEVCVGYDRTTPLPEVQGTHDLGAMKAMGVRLAMASPAYRRVDRGQLLGMIGEVAPVVCLSSGRTHEDREWVG